MRLGLELQPERAFMRRLDSVEIRELPGFVRGRHRLPSQHGRAGEQLVHELGEQALGEEVRVVYDSAKLLLGLRRRQLDRAVAFGGGNVDAPQFHFVLDLGLDPADASRALWQRRVILRVGPRALPAEFDSVFPVSCDELVVPFATQADETKSARFDRVVERLEDFADSHGGGVDEDEDEGWASLTTADGSRIALDLGAHELSLRMLGTSGSRELLVEAQRRFTDLAEPIVSVLETGARI
ncbi:hypothetical protein ENSA5_07510 [Enhygromyxa salina]|uniref:Uncharacterized protein n=1 Tax=Enhygromyxa salina TaxID=215803 RepID=A0A2S9YHD8_9BACT|nr:hypothetical protein [Enhygromyxa salina]PRQ04520.1 hypothetical protein ENSA5_07510 [Enhygromyxa salina]